MHICREVNLASSSSWIYIAYISLLLIWFLPLCWWLTKRGRKILSLYMQIRVFAYIEFMHLMFYKMGECFWMFKQKGGEDFWEKDFGCLHVSFTLLMHTYLFSFMCFIEYLIVYFYAWVKGELNISSIYSFMLSVSYIEEVDISFLCDTRV